MQNINKELYIKMLLAWHSDRDFEAARALAQTIVESTGLDKGQLYDVICCIERVENGDTK